MAAKSHVFFLFRFFVRFRGAKIELAPTRELNFWKLRQGLLENVNCVFCGMLHARAPVFFLFRSLCLGWHTISLENVYFGGSPSLHWGVQNLHFAWDILQKWAFSSMHRTDPLLWKYAYRLRHHYKMSMFRSSLEAPCASPNEHFAWYILQKLIFLNARMTSRANSKFSFRMGHHTKTYILEWPYAPSKCSKLDCLRAIWWSWKCAFRMRHPSKVDIFACPRWRATAIKICISLETSYEFEHFSISSAALDVVQNMHFAWSILQKWTCLSVPSSAWRRSKYAFRIGHSSKMNMFHRAHPRFTAFKICIWHGTSFKIEHLSLSPSGLHGIENMHLAWDIFQKWTLISVFSSTWRR